MPALWSPVVTLYPEGGVMISSLPGIDLVCTAIRGGNGIGDQSQVEDGITERWLANRASKAVELAKQKSPLIDFADMIFLPVALKLIRPWFDMVVVDEAQDMTSAQLEIAVGACKRGGRVVIVGDDRQAIYGFRGADRSGGHRRGVQ